MLLLHIFYNYVLNVWQLLPSQRNSTQARCESPFKSIFVFVKHPPGPIPFHENCII